MAETSSQRPSSSHVAPHHSQTLPPNLHLGKVPSPVNAVAFICPLQQCRSLFTHADLWKGHVEQHNLDGLLPTLDMRAALSFRVTVPVGSHLEEGQTEIVESDEAQEAGQCRTPPIQVESAHFAYAPPDPRLIGAQTVANSSLSVSPVPWAGGRPRSAGYPSSPGSNYSGPPSSHSPSPPNEPTVPTNVGIRGTLDIPRAQAYSSLSLPQQHQATSAPSYKQSFDHATIYSQGLSPSPVKITRPRSAVPHLAREVEEVSRPGTSVSYNGGPGYFHDNSPAEASPVVNFSPYPPSSAASSNFSSGFSGDIPRNTLSSSPVLNISTYQEPLQYDHSPEASASLPDFEETPDIEMDASGYPHHDHLGTTITKTTSLHIVESELEYPPSERHSPSDLWNTNYTSSDLAKETYTHLPIVTVDPVTGMTTEEAIQLFS